MSTRSNLRGSLLPVILCLCTGLLACSLNDIVRFGPTPIPTSPIAVAGAGGVAGRVWHDLCASPQQGQPIPDTAPPGCLEVGEGNGFRADGALDSQEPGIPGVQVALGFGACPSPGIATTKTGADGFYLFTGLQAGTYCVQIDPNQETNAPLMMPGSWTSPTVSEAGGIASVSVTLAEGEVKTDIYFGWDYQSLPLYEPPTLDTPTATLMLTPLPTLTATPQPMMTPTSTSTTTPTPTNTLSVTDPKSGLGEPVWKDGFETGDQWPLYEDDHVRFTVESGELIMTALNADFWNGWMLMSTVATDFYLEMTATTGNCSGRDGYGMMVRATKEDQGHIGYLFGISCDGRYSLRSWDGESYVKLLNWSWSDDVLAGASQSNRIGLWAEGDRLRLYVNGTFLTEVVDSEHTKGQFGVFVGAAETTDLTVKVDEFGYWELP
jgi:hypothetical protein